MGAETGIEWTDHTFNPWWGCTRVSPGCEHCYAEAFSKRTGHNVWGVQAERRMLSAKNWREPLNWNKLAKAEGRKHLVFCASMADVAEDRRDLDLPREWLWELIRRTDWLIFQLLTKRPENLRRLVPEDILRRSVVGTTVEDQRRADERLPELLQVPALARFVSAEPLLEEVSIWAYLKGPMRDQCLGILGGNPEMPGLDWVIVGGESGAGARPFNVSWARSLRDQCDAADVAFFMKQLGPHPHHNDDGAGWASSTEHGRHWRWDDSSLSPMHVYVQKDPKGGDIDEFPLDLKIRQFPKAAMRTAG